MKILSFAILIAAVSSTVIQLDTCPRGYGFSFSYTIAGRHGGRMRAHIRTGYAPSEEEYSSFMLNITTVNNQSMIIRNFIGVLSVDLLIVRTNFGSRFATDFANQWMMIPMHRQLIINPSNPSNFVFGGILETTRSLRDSELQVGVSVFILNTTQEQNLDVLSSVASQQVSFGIDAGIESDYIPSTQMSALYNELQSRGIRSYPTLNDEGSITRIAIGDVTDELIDTLPTIQYFVHCDSGAGVIINLFGRDYVGPRTGNRREFTLRTLRADHGMFGQPTLSKIALYVDNRNRTIGFGEPL